MIAVSKFNQVRVAKGKGLQGVDKHISIPAVDFLVEIVRAAVVDQCKILILVVMVIKRLALTYK